MISRYFFSVYYGFWSVFTLYEYYMTVLPEHTIKRSKK